MVTHVKKVVCQSPNSRTDWNSSAALASRVRLVEERNLARDGGPFELAFKRAFAFLHL